MIFKYIVITSLMTYNSVLYAEVSGDKAGKDAKVISSQTSSGGSKKQLPGSAPSEEWVLFAEQWELTRSGESILSIPVLKEVVAAWLEDQDKMIEIQYPGGEEGEFWVQGLMDWMVSLGIPSKQMLAVPGSGADDAIKFTLVK